MRVVCVKCTENNVQFASFKPEQVVNKEAEDGIQARLEENKILSDKVENKLSWECHT